MISIIIPVYNSEKFLKRCLDSVLNQTCTDWECILVDDGSKDSSGAICDEYSHRDSRFRVVHKENGGVSSARNSGLVTAKGDWITFADSDDELTTNALDDFAGGAKRYPEAEILRGGHTTICASGAEASHIVENWIVTNNHAEALRLAEKNFYSGFMWSTCFRKDILKCERFPNDITWCEDHIFTYRCMLKAKNIVFVPSVVYIYYLDDAYPVGFGKGLSYKPIDYKMAIHSAEEQRKVKLALASNDEEMKQQVEQQYKGTIHLALYYAHFRHNLFYVLNAAKGYDFISSKDIVKSWFGYNRTRVVHYSKILLELYKR